MFKKQLFFALALAGLSFGTMQAISGDWLSSEATEKTVICTGGGSESFTNIPASSATYATRTWTGDNGVAWSATDSRTDQTLTGKAIALRTSTLKNTTAVAGGIGTITFDYKRVFTGNSTLKLFVNGVQYGSDITVSSETAATFTQVVNVAGNVTIEIKNSGNRTVIDNVAFNCYELPVTGPELQITDASNANKACGEYTLDFGSHAVDVYTDAVFNVKNTGSSALTVSALNLSNNADFTIISPTVPFTVPAAGSAIVLVRFDAVTGGDKTSTLTIVNNDTNEGSCVVNLSGTGLERCAAPVINGGTLNVSGITSDSADIAVGNIVADNYIAVITTDGSLTGVPADAVNYTVGDSIGNGVVAYNGNLASFELSGLNESTAYSLSVFPYNNVDCTGGPLYTTATVKSVFTTLAAPCIGGSETFANIPASSSTYAARTWTGDNGVTWSATDARTDQTLNGKAIALRTGNLSNTTAVTGGIGTLSFNYKRIFTGNSTLKVFVNGVQYGGDVTVSSDTTAVFSQPINISGDVNVVIQNSGNRTIIDDVSWNCYTTPEDAEIQLLDEEMAPKACGNFTIDLGIVETGVTAEPFFTIRNSGLQPLEISSITVSDTINYTILSPIAPLTVDSLSTQDVIIQFNGATVGAAPAVLTIMSNDTDEATCTVSFTAEVQDACVPPVVAGDITISNQTSSSFDVTVDGVTADSYLAIITPDSISQPNGGVVYAVNDTIGSGTVVYVGASPTFNVAGLSPDTTYTIAVYGYNNLKCLGGPAYSANALETLASTLEAVCTGGTETFVNIPASSTSYATRTWTGDNGVTWSATDARTDQTLNGKAITLRVGELTNTTVISGGIDTLSFSYKRVFTNNSTLKVFVNGVQYGADIIVSSDTPAVFTQAINVSGDVTIELVNSGNRIVIDDLNWGCYSNSARKAAPAVKTTFSEVKLFPNPSTGSFQLDLQTESADVSVFNTVGKEVLRKKVSDNEILNLESAGHGVYMVVITSGTEVITKRVIIK